MAESELLALTYDALWLTLFAIAPPLAASCAAALLSAFVQGLLHIHEPVLSFAPKLLAVALTLLVMAPQLHQRLLSLFSRAMALCAHG